ncbi:MAG: phosphoribosylaminoimidazolesuccinocarboxamide synthase [Desulfomonilia bacterium]|jgi:phosphoribosylaminoimidazole-succinocarboxamide synthase|nr:phosphoribosylaminoimidazolesuccinocarboxamide synthase [Deltaproteobacteria bacterium]MDX9761155.1 phosphoribosylaminoimidazolesuccinocarboxamide synthase [Desulfomonilia bacterium]HPX18533.1 phosphoribosylaminoimidazolesuccinocarboxamide synthase [Deltaproteobacteria bacterium]
METLADYTVPGAKKLGSGKVREIFEADADHLLIVTTDRLSAFDIVLPDTIPGKGRVLNQISLFWFRKTSHIIDNHVVSAHVDKYPEPFTGDPRLKGRSVLVKKAGPLPVECIVRGYISGSGWKEYLSTGCISGMALPRGLKEAEKLPEPLFTPSTKAEPGRHDENISFESASEMIGHTLMEKVRDVSLAIYSTAYEYALGRGIIIADTKFEFGLIGGELVFIDEAITPDSSRFWPRDGYAPGGPQPSFDKQFVRDYLETLDWGKTPPGPHLPEDVVRKTSQKYLAAYEILTGRSLSL